jgi:phage internal scaffolding protein
MAKYIIHLKDKNWKKHIDRDKPGKTVFMLNGRVIKVVTVTGKGQTEQAHEKQCDMNYILRDYQKTGLVKHAKAHEGQYDDVTVSDFQDAMFLVTEAKNMFDALPSNIRTRFENDPAKFLGFVQNPANGDELKALGILKGNDGVNKDGEPVSTPTEENPNPTPS